MNIAEVLSNLTFLWVQDGDDPVKVAKHMRFAEGQVAMLNQVASHTMSFASGSQKMKSSDLVALTEAALRIHHQARREVVFRILCDADDLVIVESIRLSGSWTMDYISERLAQGRGVGEVDSRGGPKLDFSAGLPPSLRSCVKAPHPIRRGPATWLLQER